jgi:predicted protein tyrosine phosphatase
MDTFAPKQKLLFICSRNMMRSPTGERMFDGSPNYQARSAGTESRARIVVTAGHIGWADIIFCMEKAHLSQLQEKFSKELEGKTVVSLHIPDDYVFMQPELVDELRSKLAEYVTVPDKI